MSLIKLIYAWITSALEMFTLLGWEYFCLRRVFPGQEELNQ
jgi:hypothetical protein